MNVIILAGGFGTRLGDIAKETPKALLPVAGKPVIEYILEKLELLDIGRIYISTNKKFEPLFQQWLKPRREGIVRSSPQPRFPDALDALRSKIRLVVEPAFSEEQKFGSVGAWRYLLWKERPKGDLLSISGDNIFSFDLGVFLAKAQGLPAPSLVLHDVKTKEEARKFGVCQVNERHELVSLTEKPDDPASTLISTGIYYFPERYLRYIEEYVAAGNNRDSAGRFLAWLCSHTTIYAFTPLGQWVDIGSPESYDRAQQVFRL